jgi:hypothetical protein
MTTPTTKPSTAAANEYSIYVSGINFDQTSNILTFSVGLMVTDGDLAGFGLRLHYDDTNLTFSDDKLYSLSPNGSTSDTPNLGIDAIFSTGVLSGLGHISQPDTDNKDSLAATTAFINTNWIATVLNGSVVTWPGASNKDVKLYEINFTVTDTTKTIPFKFSAREVAEGYSLSEASQKAFSIEIGSDGTITDNAIALFQADQIETGIAGAADTFTFTNTTDPLGKTLIQSFNSMEDEILFSGFDYSKIIFSLDSEGDDRFIFSEDAGNSSEVKVETEGAATTLSLRNSVSQSLKLIGEDETNVTVSSQGIIEPVVSLVSSSVKIMNVTDLKTQIKKVGDSAASDPINLSDVLAQLKHIIGLRELKANALQAGDTNNDGEVNLSDVLDNLKHIIGLREIDTFDLVTDNGFAINALDADSKGNLTLVINGDADQSHADWDLV